MAKKKTNAFIPKAMCKAMDSDLPASVETLADRAIKENPANAPMILVPEKSTMISVPKAIRATLTTRWWGGNKTHFLVGFMERTTPAVADRIIGFMNVWNKVCALSFSWTNDIRAADWRVAFAKDGYWSNVGLDCKSVPQNRPTMNLQGMNNTTFSEKEGLRVIPHEAGHGFGMPHEHSRKEIVQRLDEQATIRVFRRDQGWDEPTVRAQILTPINQSAIHASTAPDETSIMCYWFTGECTKNGQPIVGGSDLSTLDKSFAGRMWPAGIPEPPVVEDNIVTAADGTRWKVLLTRP